MVIAFVRFPFHEHLQSSLENINAFSINILCWGISVSQHNMWRPISSPLHLFTSSTLHHLNFTWHLLALLLERVLDSWSLLPLSTPLLLYAIIIPPLSCTFCRLKTPSLSSSFYKTISLPLIILTSPVPFPFNYISSNAIQEPPQRAFIRQVQHASVAHQCSQCVQNDGGFGCRKPSGQGAGRRGTVHCQNLALENSHTTPKSVFNFANKQHKEGIKSQIAGKYVTVLWTTFKWWAK